jgi:hypothetical protein
VTQPFLTVLLSTQWFRDNYVISDSEGSTVYPYGVAMGVHRRVATCVNDIAFTLHVLPSNMSRRFLRVLIGVCTIVRSVSLRLIDLLSEQAMGQQPQPQVLQVVLRQKRYQHGQLVLFILNH